MLSISGTVGINGAHSAEPLDEMRGEMSAKKQSFDNSCGAASLLCAAKELGIKEIPVLKGSMSETFQDSKLELDNRCESDIYRITSGASLGANSSENLTNAGYSMPHNLNLAIRLMGLEPTIHMKPNIFSRILPISILMWLTTAKNQVHLLISYSHLNYRKGSVNYKY